MSLQPIKLAQIHAHERDARVTFDEGPHIYVVDGKYDKENTSVTTLVHKCFPVFDADKQAARMANDKVKMADPTYKYYGMTKADILKAWKQTSTLGTSLHYNIECYYNDIPPPNPDTTEFQIFLKFAKEYPHLKPHRTEWVIFYEEIKLCGSIDMVFFNQETSEYEIYDWKRVLQINDKPFKKDDMGVLPFLQDIPNANFWHYTMQLNIYKKVLETKYGLKISRLFLVVIHPDHVYKTFLRLELPDIQDKVTELFAYRLENLSKQETQDPSGHGEPASKPPITKCP